jgi:hypothetical protein
LRFLNGENHHEKCKGAGLQGWVRIRRFQNSGFPRIVLRLVGEDRENKDCVL